MKAISELMLGKISKTDFLQENDIIHIEDVIEKGLETAYEKKDVENTENFLYLIFKFEVFNKKYVNILNKLLISDWHYKHEDIVTLCKKSLQKKV